MSRLASIRATLSFLIAAAIAMLALAGVGLHQVARLQAANDWVTHTRNVLAQADEVRQLLVDAEAAARGYTISQDARFRDRYADAVRALPGRRRRSAAPGAGQR